MKKLILSVAVLAVAASCSQNEVSDISVTSATTPISFSSLNDRVVTKAANDTSSDFLVLSRMSSVNSETTGITGWYLQDVFSATTSTATSLSNTTHYWPTGADETLDFLAIAPTPYDVNGNKDSRFVSAGTGNAQYNIEQWNDYNGGDVIFTFQSEDGQTDLTAARSLDIAAQTSDVSLDFAHLLAKIIVNVKLYQPEDDYTSPSLTGYTLNNGFPGTEDTATYLQTTFNAHTQRGIYYLNMDGDNDATIAELIEGDDDARALPGFGYYTHPAVTSATNMAPLYSAEDLNIVPQYAPGCVIRLSDMIVLTDDGSTFFTQASGGYMNYTIQEGDIYTSDETEADYFHPGYVYILNLVLDADSFNASTITFYAECETDWINAESGVESDYESTLDDIDYNDGSSTGTEA